MISNDKTKSGKRARLIGAGLFAAVCAAPPAANAQTQSDLVFGQKSSEPGLLNRMFGGARSEPAAAPQAGDPAPGQPAGASGPAAAGHAPAAAQQAAADEGTNGDSPFPKQYLLNKMFSRESLGLEPVAPAPAAKTP